MKKTLLLFIFLFSTAVLKADSTQAASSSSVKYVLLHDLLKDTLEFRLLDTLVDNFQNFNPIQKDLLPVIYLGNLGTAYLYQTPFSSDKVGYDLGRPHFDKYIGNKEALRFYRTRSPFSRLTYIWNQKKEQVFNLEFAQNITPRLSYALNFNRLVSLGDYQRQASDHLQFDASVWYRSKNRKYVALAGYTSTSLRTGENGGIKNDSIFQVSSDFSTEFEPVYLNNAQNRIDVKHFFYKQSYAIGNKDTVVIDTFKIARIHPRLRVSHAFDYISQDYTYRESAIDSGFYPSVFLDSSASNDFIQTRNLENEFMLEYYGNPNAKSNLYKRLFASLKHNAIEYENLDFDSSFNYLTLSLGAERFFSPTTKLSLKNIMVVAGTFELNRISEATLMQHITKDGPAFVINVINRNQSPSISSLIYRSNHLRWNNDFENTLSTDISLGFIHKDWDFWVYIKWSQFRNYIYYNQNARPDQYTGSIDVYAIELKKDFDFGRFHLDNRVTIQSTNEEAIMPLPLLHTYNSFYFERPLFKKAMLLRTGFDSRYYTKYKGYNYDPASMQFYLDPNASFGDYPVIDFFLMAKVKRAKLMLKLEHLNDKLFKQGDYYIARYPIAERSFKIGVSWGFYD